MSSDLQTAKIEEVDPKKAPQQILKHEIAEGKVAP